MVIYNIKIIVMLEEVEKVVLSIYFIIESYMGNATLLNKFTDSEVWRIYRFISPMWM